VIVIYLFVMQACVPEFTLLFQHWRQLTCMPKRFKISTCLLHHTIERCWVRAFFAVAKLLVFPNVHVFLSVHARTEKLLITNFKNTMYW